MTLKSKLKGTIKKSGSYHGKSNELGHGGRAAQLTDKLEDKHLPESEVKGIVGKIAHEKHAAPGEKNYHGHK